ncbi:hypothetical protein HOLleu_41528 [Holothuria leucospilota]|uniref:Transmembrane protein 163 n=1 Tax=Holothuria leucospilota TaxID=206669 RepID=A0A9Q0YBM9_HOLLE|nr:hypothetical protein HOLleu_41528 [Holothuria leucospilota]
MGNHSIHKEGYEGKEHEYIELLPTVEEDEVESSEPRQRKRFQTKSCNHVCRNFRHLSERDVVYYLKAIVLISWLSIIFSGFIGSASMVMSYTCNSSAAFGFAFDCITDIVSSIVVIWRFSGYHGDFSQEQSEKITLVALGTIFLISCVFTLYDSISSLVHSMTKNLQDAEQFDKHVTYRLDTCEGVWGLSIAALSCLAFLVITSAIVYIGIKLKSRSIKADGIIGVVALITTFSWFFSMVTMEIYPQLWFLEDAVGLFVGLFCLSYGVWLISELVALIRNGKKEQGRG